MSTFSSILSSIGGQQNAPQPALNGQQPSATRPAIKKANTSSDISATTPGPPVPGVKRKSEEAESNPRSKLAKLEESRPYKEAAASAAGNRFQLSTKQVGRPQAVAAPVRSSSSPAVPSNPHRSTPKAALQQNEGPAKSNAPPPAKRGFASIMERAKAAQEAAKTAGSSTIKHKSAEKLTRRERKRIMEAAKAEQAANRRRNGTNDSRDKGIRLQQDSQTKSQGIGHKDTTRKPPEPLAYKGTMRNEGAGDAASKKRKGEAQDKYGGYASWSDLDDAEEEEDDYDSEGSSDMEGGFDDVEREEFLATRAARKEDQEALEEEERHRREKLERKRKLMALNESAKARKKY